MTVRAASEHAKRDAAVAATRAGELDGERLPAGEVHGWWHGQTETACGLALSRSQLVRFGALRWRDVQPDSGGSADLVTEVCGRCASVLRPRGAHADGPSWTRSSPRP